MRNTHSFCVTIPLHVMASLDRALKQEESKNVQKKTVRAQVIVDALKLWLTTNGHEILPEGTQFEVKRRMGAPADIVQVPKASTQPGPEIQTPAVPKFSPEGKAWVQKYIRDKKEGKR